MNRPWLARFVALLVTACLLLGGCTTTVKSATPAPSTAPPTLQAPPAPTYFTATVTHDTRMSACPQVDVALPPIDFTGQPVEIEYSMEYVNFIPDGGPLTSVFFDLYVDGVLGERLGVFGAHSTTQNRHAPIYLTDIYDGARTLTGTHTLSIVAYNWSGTCTPDGQWASGMDAYLRGGPGSAADPTRPRRLTVKYL